MALEARGKGVYALWAQVGQPDVDIHVVRIGPDVVTAIAVSGFGGAVSGSAARLTWYVTDPAEVGGFRVYRADGPAGGFLQVGPGVIPADHGGEYAWVDASVGPGRTYQYRLEVLDRSGSSQWQGPVELAMPAVVSRLTWQGISPNPSRGSVRLLLAAPSAGLVRVRVYDVTGHQITALDAPLSEDQAMIEWDGRDHNGRQVPAGVYLLRAECGQQSALQRLVRI
jgi:hypothetical protein